MNNRGRFVMHVYRCLRYGRPGFLPGPDRRQVRVVRAGLRVPVHRSAPDVISVVVLSPNAPELQRQGALCRAGEACALRTGRRMER